MIRQISHLCFDTGNPAALVDFYANKLGLPLKFTLKTKDGRDFGFFIACGDSTFIEIFDRNLKSTVWGNGAPPPPIQKGNQYQHFCFEVADLDDFKTKLENAGVKVGPISTGLSKNLQAWTADPDGNSIELMQYTPDSLHLHPPTYAPLSN